MRKLTVSLGTVSPAVITTVKAIEWDAFAAWLTKAPPEVADKAERGWYIPATFDPVYRDSDNFICRDCITFDFDHVTLDTWGVILAAWESIAFAIYTTYSHSIDSPRFRVVLPLSRPAGYDEFQAVARKVATDVGIELIARESFVPAQMMYAPTRKPMAPYESFINKAEWLDVDAVLAEYEDWTDVKQWPHRVEADGVHKISDGQLPPDEKPGTVGDFCRAFRVAEAITRFQLPYSRTSTEGRWTYANGSRPEGAIEYDDGLKFHSHHDTDPARGQNNAFDLVRLHRFASLDAGTDPAVGVSDRPSYRAMVDFVRSLPEFARKADEEFVALDPLPVVTEELQVDATGNTVERFAVRSADEFSSGAAMEWVIRGVLPRAELAVVYGESGSGKSFLALDLCAAITRGVTWRDRRVTAGNVVYVCAEGAGGFKARLRAYARGHNVDLHVLPAVIPDAPNLLDPKDAALITHQILKWGKPDVVVIDTLSATAPGGNENSGEDMGLVLSHCKLLHRKTGALVVLIHHSGKDATKGARGWSGLRAAADAEIEVTRNGDFRAATVTKMKDGSDGEQWPFKLKSLILGMDADGEEESSCIIEHTEEASPMASKRPLVGRQKLIYDTLATMAPSGSCNLEDLLEGAKLKIPKPDGRDIRRQWIRAEIEKLVSKGMIYMQGEDRVSLHNVVESDEAWLK